MSRKLDTFRNALGNPLSIHNFTVTLQGALTTNEVKKGTGAKKPTFDATTPIEDFQITVQSTQLPSDQLQEVLLHYLGENVRFPTIPNNGGVWPVVVPDNEQGQAFFDILVMRGMWFTQVSGKVNAMQTTGQNIVVTMRTVNDEDVYSVKLHNCYCRGRNSVDLNAGQPTTSLQFNCEFVYDWLEDLDKNGQTAQGKDSATEAKQVGDGKNSVA